MTKVKWTGSIVWLCTSLTLGCIAGFPGDGDDDAGDDSASSQETGGSEVSGPITVSGPFDTEGDGWTSMGSTDSMGTTEPWSSTSDASTISGTATCGDCTATTTSTTGSEGPAQVCGVEIEHDPYWDNTYICGCEACNVQFDNVVPASGEALLAECECICYEVGCGGSVSGGATSGIPDEDTGWWGTEDTGGTFGSTDPGTASEPTTASSEDSGQGSDDTDPTG